MTQPALDLRTTTPHLIPPSRIEELRIMLEDETLTYLLNSRMANLSRPREFPIPSPYHAQFSWQVSADAVCFTAPEMYSPERVSRVAPETVAKQVIERLSSINFFPDPRLDIEALMHGMRFVPHRDHERYSAVAISFPRSIPSCAALTAADPADAAYFFLTHACSGDHINGAREWIRGPSGIVATTAVSLFNSADEPPHIANVPFGILSALDLEKVLSPESFRNIQREADRIRSFLVDHHLIEQHAEHTFCKVQRPGRSGSEEVIAIGFLGSDINHDRISRCIVASRATASTAKRLRDAIPLICTAITVATVGEETEEKPLPRITPHRLFLSASPLATPGKHWLVFPERSRTEVEMLTRFCSHFAIDSSHEPDGPFSTRFRLCVTDDDVIIRVISDYLAGRLNPGCCA